MSDRIGIEDRGMRGMATAQAVGAFSVLMVTARAGLAAAWLLWLGLASGAALAHETTAPERPVDEAAQSRLSVILDASGALSLQLEGPDTPPPGPWGTDRESLAEDIRERLQLADRQKLLFRGSPDASYGMVVDILARLSDAGYRPRIVIEGR